MKKVLFFLVTVVALSYAISSVEVDTKEWENFKEQQKKRYRSGEEQFRMKIFMKNIQKIKKHNIKYEQGLVTYKLGVNEYADMSRHEFIITFNGYFKNEPDIPRNTYQKPVANKFVMPALVTLPDAVDWKEEGAVTPIKNQGKCGSCWAFSATGALEGQHFRQTGKLVSLSEQNLMDCSRRRYGNFGCSGGNIESAFSYIKDIGGIDTEESYPYEAKKDKCRYNPRNSGAEDTGFTEIEEGNEHKLKAAVATIGPVSVAIDASQQSFHLYSDGIYHDPECSTTDLDHAVLVVGYGTDENNQDYWLVKNSWGETWGKKGYIKMARNKNNTCGIASRASYPLV